MLARLFSRYWLLLPLLLLVVVVRDWVEAPAPEKVEETVDMRQSEADYYLESFTTRKFDLSGKVEYVVMGNTLTHYPDDDRAEIVKPEVILHRPGQIWNLSADQGQLVQNPEVFMLSGNVDIVRRPVSTESLNSSEDGDDIQTGALPSSTAASPTPGGSERVRIRTENVTVHLESNQVSTDKPISIVAETWQLNAVGLQSSIDDGKLELLSNVTGKFDVAKPE